MTENLRDPLTFLQHSLSAAMDNAMDMGMTDDDMVRLYAISEVIQDVFVDPDIWGDWPESGYLKSCWTDEGDPILLRRSELRPVVLQAIKWILNLKEA